jgi:uncharacterized membrane protein YcaP (DUF421 family)
MTIPDFGSDLVSVALRTAVVYVFLVLGFRLLGKREAGQLTTLDLVVLLVIANAVQNAMVGENTSLLGGLLAAGVILLLDLALHAAAGRWKRLRDALDGQPTMLVQDGVVLDANLRREGLTDRELGVALRQNGLLTTDQARYVFLETNGTISVIPWRDEDEEEGEPGTGPGTGSDASAAPHPLEIRAVRRRRRRGRLGGTS